MANINAPKIDNTELEQAIAVFKQDQTKENLIEILKKAEKAIIFQPVLVREKDGKKIPEPVIVKNAEEEVFFTVFTSAEHISEDMKDSRQPMIAIPFAEVAKLSQSPNLNLNGIVFNPFTDNLILHPKAVELLVNSVNSAKPQQVTMTPKQLHQLVLNQTAKKAVPKAFFADADAFLNQLAEEKEEKVCQILKQGYDNLKGFEHQYAYVDTDMEVMVLNISDDTRMARITLPGVHRAEGIAMGIFLFFNPLTEDKQVYVIIKGGKDGNLLMGVDEALAESDLGVAPDEGSELYELLERLPWKKVE